MLLVGWFLVCGAISLGVAPQAEAYAPSTPFDWEGYLLNPAKTDLIDPAKSVLTNPTFLEGVETAAPPGVPATTQGPAGVSRWSKLLGGSGMLGAVSKLLPWVAGATIGYEVCNAISAGCFLFDTSPLPSKGTLTWSGPTTTVTQYHGASVPRNAYFATTQTWRENWPCPSVPSGLLPFPTFATKVIGQTTNVSCSGTLTPMAEWIAHYTPEAIGSQHTYTDNSAIPNASSPFCPSVTALGAPATSCTTTPPVDWSKRLAAMLQGAGTNEEGLSRQEIDDLGKAIEARLNPPAGTFVTVPACTGLTYPDCSELLDALGFDPIREAVDWRDAYVDRPGQAVIRVVHKGQEVEVGTVITVVTNPNTADMPRFIPMLPTNPNADIAIYVALLEEQGFAYALNVLPEADADPTHGPSTAVSVNPGEGTRQPPASEGTLPPVQVGVNPPGVPVIGGGGVPCETPAIRSFDLSPLMNHDLKNVFPFGLIFWTVEWAGDTFQTTQEAPTFSFVLGDDNGIDWTLDLADAEPIMNVVRPVLLVTAFIGTWFFAASLFTSLWGWGSRDRED